MPKGRSKAKSTTRTLPWWVSGGEEECPHCGQPYAREVEFRCPDCDGPCCPHCKKRHVEDRHVCPECVEGSEEPAIHEGHWHG
jgi:hypothetical protein